MTLVLEPHDARCYAIAYVSEGRWAHPWILHPNGAFVTRDTNGGYKGQTTQWLRLLCHDVHCTARVNVTVDWLLEAVNNEVVGARV